MESIDNKNRIELCSTEIAAHKNEGNPYVLFLGAGCSVTSGCPVSKNIVDRINKTHHTTYKSLSDAENLGLRFFNLELNKILADSKPSKGYWYLAELIKFGYFDLILTTNFDSCLEQTLSKVLKYDEFKVFIRGDVDDKRLNELLLLSTPKVKILKLHGDSQSRNMLVKGNLLLDINNEDLKGTLKRKIKSNGLLVIGSSLSDNLIHSFCPKDEESQNWFINYKSPNYESNTANNLHTLNILGQKQICGIKDEMFFDKFFYSLSKAILLNNPKTKDLDVIRNLLLKTINTEELNNSCKIEIDRSNINQKVEALISRFNKIENTQKTKANLFFIHDPDAPGGTEMLKIMKNDFKHFLDDKNIFTIEIKGRDSKLLNREAGNFFIEKNNKKEIANQSNFSEDQNRFWIFDSVSFSGGTIKAVINKINNEITFDKIIKVGLLFKGTEFDAIEGLNDNDIIFIERINSHQILFPWGWTSSTKQVIAPSISNPNFRYENVLLDAFVPNRFFSFFPRPWGNIFSLVENKNVSVKILYINPREKTSKHQHFIRDEVFLILDEHVSLRIFDENFILRRGSTFRVPSGVEHRFVGLDVPCRVLEIAFNYNNQIDDIVRSEDKYGRKDKDGSE